MPRNKRKHRAHEQRTHRRQAKRRAVKAGYKPRTVPKSQRKASYGQVRRAVDFALLHHFLMGRA